MRALHYGDNLEILRRYLPDESVDLVYLDPPFKSRCQSLCCPSLMLPFWKVQMEHKYDRRDP